MHILITGGAGYIGSHVAKQLIEETNHNVTIIDNLSTGFRDTIDRLYGIFHHSPLNAHRSLDFIEADLSNWDEIAGIFKARRFDAVIHFAASLIVPESVQNPLKYYLNNTANTANLVRLCSNHKVNRFIFSSTAAVYGEPDFINSPLTTQHSTPKIREDFPTLPINPYGRSKLMSEWVLHDAAAAHPEFSFIALRYFNVAGADLLGRIGQSTLNATHLIKVAAETALGKRAEMSIFGDDYPTPDGTCVRDYIHVEDLASAHLKALDLLSHPSPITHHPSPIFNVGYGRGYSVKEVIETMKKVSGVDFGVKIAPRRAGDPAMLVADNTKIKEAMGWVPKYDDLELICRTALEWEKGLSRDH